MNSTLPREGFRPRARRLLGRLAAVLVVGALAFAGAPAAIADDVDSSDPTEAVALHLSAGARTQPGAPLVSTVTVQNSTSTPLSAGTVTLEMDPTPLADSAALDAWLDEDAAEGTFRTLASEASPAVAAASRASLGIVVDTADLGELAPGVYPLRARLTGVSTGSSGASRNGTLTATTVVVVSEQPDGPTAVLVPLTATPEDGVLLTAEELADLTSADGALTGQLDAVTGTSAILAIDPAIPAAIRMLGTSAPASAVEWLTRLERLPNDIFPLQFGDADATVQAQARLPTLLTPPDLTPLMDESDFPTPTASATPSPTASPSAAADTLVPGHEALTTLKGAQGGILWPRPNVTVTDLQTFDGYLGEPVTTILPSTSIAGTAPAHGDAGGHEVLVSDAASSARLSDAVELTDSAAVDRELAAVAGHVFFASQQSPTLILALDRSETRSPVAVRDALTMFASPAMSLDSLRAQDPAPVALTAEESAQPRASALDAMLADEQSLTAFSTILDEPSLLLAPSRIRVLRTIGAGLDDSEFTSAAAALSKRTRTTLGAVTIQQPKPVQLFTSAAPLPVWIRNDLPWTVNVRLHSHPSDIRLDIQPLTEVEALASSSTRVDVPIEARVASGDVQVDFRIDSPTGVPIGEPAVADVTLRAEWESIGLGILGAIIIVLFALGLVRTVRRKRRESTADGE